MSMDLTLVAHATYLHVVMTGVLNLDESKELFSHIIATCIKHGLNRIVVDVRPLVFPRPLTTFKRFEFASFVAAQIAHQTGRVQGRIRVAIVSYAEHIDKHGFGETVAANRGADLRITPDMAEALAWLGVDPADAPA